MRRTYSINYGRIWNVFLATMLVSGAGAAVVGGAEARKPNVLLISIDDLNDWTGCLGGHPQAKTPHIDRLAERGTLFANAHCQSPVCNPSRASLLTGRHPHSSGVYFLSPDLKQAPTLKELDTLPERFAKHGYRTLAAGKIFHTGDKRFFQEYGGSFGGFGPRPKKKISQPHGHPLWDWGAYPKRDEDMPDYKIAQWAVEKLQAQPVDSDTPFFLGVGFLSTSRADVCAEEMVRPLSPRPGETSACETGRSRRPQRLCHHTHQREACFPGALVGRVSRRMGACGCRPISPPSPLRITAWAVC